MLPKRTRFARSAFSFAFTLFCSSFVVASHAQTTTAFAPVPSRLTKPVDESQLETLKGTLHPLASKANDRGAVDQGMPLERLQVMLKRSAVQEAALQQTLQDLHRPGTASYHKWLTPAQFGERFGPSNADIATLTAWLGSHGFAVTRVNPGKQTLEISGNAGQFQTTFHAAIHRYVVQGKTQYANASDPQIPAALASVFGGFASLNNFPMKSYAKSLGTAQVDKITHQAKPNWTQGATGYYPTLLLAPADFAVQYDLNPLYTAGVTGAGQTIAIINESNIDLALVNQYRSLFGLPVNPPNVIIDGNDPGIDGVNNPGGPNGASGEAYVDVELAGAAAPDATIDLVIAGDTALASGLTLAMEHAVYANVAPVLSLSFGSCEALDGSRNQQISALWEQAAAQGQTVMVSTGDTGSATCDNDTLEDFAVNGTAVNALASTPYNVAVGGTDMYFTDYALGGNGNLQGAAKYWNLSPTNSSPIVSLMSKAPEQPFNSSQFGLDYLPNLYPVSSNGSTLFAAGGGPSSCSSGTGSTCAGYPKPSWQTGAGVPADAVRDLPDVSMFGALSSNLVVTPVCAADGDCQPVAAGGTVQVSEYGGTSLSAPSFAGIMSLVNQKYGPQGQADYVLYPLAKQFPAAFNDITNGTISVPCNITAVQYRNTSYLPLDCIAVPNPLQVTNQYFGTATEGQIGDVATNTAEYNAGTGYDLASGLGSVDANNLVSNWNKVTFAGSSVTLVPSSTAFAHGTAITISGMVTPGSAGGAVALETTSSGPVNPAAPIAFTVSNGTYTGSVTSLPGGTYDIFGVYGGDGTNGPSTSSKTSITVTPEASTTSLSLVDASGSAVSTTAALPYGTQLLLDAKPSGVNSAGNSNAPTGTINYLSGTTSVGSVSLNAEGQAELNYAPVPSATAYAITAQYAGDASYSASTSAPATFTITKNVPNIGLSSGTEDSSALNLISGVTALTVQVENSAEYAAFQNTPYAYVNSPLAPTGVVTITGLPSGTLTSPMLSRAIDASNYLVEGVTTLPLPVEAAGTYLLTISYSGDANYASQAATTTVTVANPTGITTTTTASAVPAVSASTAALVSVTITGTSNGGPLSGTISFFSSGIFLGTVTIPSGYTSSTYSNTITLNGFLATGSNQLTVQYSGSSVYAPSYAVATIANGGSAGFSLAASGAINVVAGSNGTSTISVTPLAGLTGSVALTCAVTPIQGATVPTCSIASPAILNGGATTATLTVNTVAATTGGNYTVTVNGVDGSLTSAVTVPVLVTTTGTVTPVPAVTLSSSGSISIASPGGSGTSTISVVPSGGFTGAVSLACVITSTAAEAPSCSFGNTGTASITGTAAATATLTVNTTAASAAMEKPRFRMLPLSGGIAAATLLFFLVPVKRRRLSTLLGVLLLVAVAGFSAGCGSGTSAPSGGGNAGTPAGAYSVTVTGTANGVTIAPVNVSVTVQ